VDATRRSFLKIGTGAVVASVLGFDLKAAYAEAKELKIARTTETRSTCPYCSVSCGVIIHTIGDKAKNVTPQVVHVEGDPDHPINRGTLCPKGSSPQGIVADAGYPERPPAIETAGPTARLRSLGRHRLGPGHRRSCAPYQEDPR
jgi:formate dehydrogenase major subunit